MATLTAEQVVALLREAPVRIAALTDGATPAQLRAAPVESEWSATGVLAHLRACADVWGDCIAAIHDQDHPTLRAVNPRTWVESTDYPELDFAPSFDAYRRQRAALLDLLEPLPAQAWLRTATVTGAGRPLERTLHFYAQWLATHERPHVKQIGRAVDAVRG